MAGVFNGKRYDIAAVLTKASAANERNKRVHYSGKGGAQQPAHTSEHFSMGGLRVTPGGSIDKRKAYI